MKARLHADGWLDISDRRRVRTPGNWSVQVEPADEAEALAFLLSHAFPGHRRVVKRMSAGDRRKIKLAMWADSVSERMALVDRVWRNITEPVNPPDDGGQPQLVQVIRYGDAWVYPLYLDGSVTRVLPHGGLPAPVRDKALRRRELQLDLSEG
ncbi:MAG: hypothetical protein D6701_04030 [Gemmatimonadetes bacterium]|nr:MAG: hypothetical protein D6701_04030 [Gemmatimonadota bacterium]